MVKVRYFGEVKKENDFKKAVKTAVDTEENKEENKKTKKKVSGRRVKDGEKTDNNN